MMIKNTFTKIKIIKIVLPNSGSLMVMDIENGEILCSVSSPGFDPNIFSNELGTKEWNSLKKKHAVSFFK